MKKGSTVSVFYLACVSHHFFVKKEPRQELGRSHRVNLLLRTTHKHSWPPGNTKIIHEAGGCMPANTSFKEDFMLFNVTFMSVSLGMWSLKSSTELTKKGMWQDNTCRRHDRKKKMSLLLRLLRNRDCFSWLIHPPQGLQKTPLPFEAVSGWSIYCGVCNTSPTFTFTLTMMLIYQLMVNLKAIL